MRTHKQQLASILHRNEYKGCHGQVEHCPRHDWHFGYRGAVALILAPDTLAMRKRFPKAKADSGDLYIALIAIKG